MRGASGSNPEIQLTAPAPRYEHHRAALEDNVGGGDARGKAVLQPFDVDAAHAGGIGGVQPPYRLRVGLRGQLFQHGWQRELEPFDALEEPACHHLAGKLHEPETAEKS